MWIMSSTPELDRTCEVIDAQKMRELEEQNEILNCSLIALTTHCAQVQFRLRQIVDAPRLEREGLLKDLEAFVFRGIPELNNSIIASPSMIESRDLEERILQQRSKQKDLVSQLKIELKTFEGNIKETENIYRIVKATKNDNEVDEGGTNMFIPSNGRCRYINHASDSFRIKDHFVEQLKLQISDLERFVAFLKDEKSFINCKFKCNNTNRLFFGTLNFLNFNGINTISFTNYFVAFIKKMSTNILMFKPIVNRWGHNTLLSKAHHWGNLRAKLEIAISNVVNVFTSNDLIDFGYVDMLNTFRHDFLTYTVRNQLVPCIRNLLQHGLRSHKLAFLEHMHPSFGKLHAWQLILLFYERKKGKQYNSSPSRKLSQSFDLDIQEARSTTIKHELLQIIDQIISLHHPYKGSFDSHFKNFVFAALNSGRLVMWLRSILTCRKLIEQCYQPWSYVAMTGFDDGLQSLDILSNYEFDLLIRRFNKVKDAF